MADLERIRRIYEAIIELPAGEREDALRRACSGDVELQRFVELMLMTHGGTGGEAAGTDQGKQSPNDRDDIGPEASESRTASHDGPPVGGAPGDGTLAGDAVPGYRLVRRIGSGGFADVYLAIQESSFKRRVAVKILRGTGPGGGADASEILHRFRTERQVLAVMEHRAIASVFEAGTTRLGRAFMSMEYIDGKPITSYAAEMGLTLGERLGMMQEVARGVDHAHSRGVIHRDLKPSNILVRNESGQHAPKIIDFGVAKATRPALAAMSGQTLGAALVGTLDYMSPEQIGRSDTIDARTDLYSLGVILYELLTGLLPVDIGSHAARGFAAAEQAVLTAAPLCPSERLRITHGVGGLGETVVAHVPFGPAEIPAALDDLVMRCLAKNASDRPASAGDMARSLGGLISNASGSHAVPATPRRPRRARRLPLPAALGAALVIGAAVLVRWGLHERHRGTSDAAAAAPASELSPSTARADVEATADTMLPVPASRARVAEVPTTRVAPSRPENGPASALLAGAGAPPSSEAPSPGPHAADEVRPTAVTAGDEGARVAARPVATTAETASPEPIKTSRALPVPAARATVRSVPASTALAPPSPAAPGVIAPSSSAAAPPPAAAPTITESVLAGTLRPRQSLADSRDDWAAARGGAVVPPQGHGDSSGLGSWYYGRLDRTGGFVRAGAADQLGRFASEGALVSSTSQRAPTAEGAAVRRWKTAVRGQIRIVGRARRERTEPSAGARVRVVGGGVTIWERAIAGDTNDPVSIAVDTVVPTDGIIDFAVFAEGGAPEFVQLDVKVMLTDEQPSVSGLALLPAEAEPDVARARRIADLRERALRLDASARVTLARVADFDPNSKHWAVDGAGNLTPHARQVWRENCTTAAAYLDDLLQGLRQLRRVDEELATLNEASPHQIDILSTYTEAASRRQYFLLVMDNMTPSGIRP